MPIYEYACPRCGTLEVMQKITDVPLVECPYCLEQGVHNPVTRLISSTSFVLKGSGWYKTDYGNGKSSSNGRSDNTKSSAGKNESAAVPEKKPAETKSSAPTTGETANSTHVAH